MELSVDLRVPAPKKAHPAKEKTKNNNNVSKGISLSGQGAARLPYCTQRYRVILQIWCLLGSYCRYRCILFSFADGGL